MKKSLSILFSVCLLLGIEACEPQSEIKQDTTSANARLQTNSGKAFEDPSVQGDYQVRDGMLYFKSIKTFFALDSALNKLDASKKIEFTQKVGFKSLLEIRFDVMHSLNEAGENPEKYKKIIQTNSDILKAEGDDLITLFSDVNEHLINREGLMSIGGKIHCFKNGKTIIASSISEIRETLKTGSKANSKVTYIDEKSQAGARATAGTCATIDRQAYNGDNNRRADVLAYIQYTPYYSYTDPYGVDRFMLQWVAVTRGRAFKKNLIGSWTYYETDNTLTARYSAYIYAQRVVIPNDGRPVVNYNDHIDHTVYNYSTEANWNETLVTAYDIPAIELPGTGPSAIVVTSYVSGYSSNLGSYVTTGVPSGVPIDCL
jgi:hypothetical protein